MIYVLLLFVKGYYAYVFNKIDGDDFKRVIILITVIMQTITITALKTYIIDPKKIMILATTRMTVRKSNFRYSVINKMK